MTLINPEGTVAKAHGTRSHWRLFTRYQDSALVQALTGAIDRHLATLAGGAIDSSLMGTQLLQELAREDHPEARALTPQALSSLFGMALWHHLACREEVWCCRRIRLAGQAGTRMMYFQPGPV